MKTSYVKNRCEYKGQRFNPVSASQHNVQLSGVFLLSV